MSYKGIDVSDNQGVIAWPRVAEAGVDFAILRSIRGSGKIDNQFYNNLSGCRVNGIPFDVYKYTYATTIAKAIAEATAVIKLLQENDIHCTVWWDAEDQSLRGLGKSALTKLIKAAQDVVEKAGYHFGIYCNTDWYKNVLDVKAFDCPFWVARYPSNDRMELSAKPSDKYKPVVTHELFGWQYSSKGSIPGISGNVDLDMIYADINENTGENPGTAEGGKNPYPKPAYSLYRGRLKMSAAYVKWLQYELIRTGYLPETKANGKSSIDGDFGAATEAALDKFQRDNPSTSDMDRKAGGRVVEALISS